jgi:hypothetical protein
MKNIPSFKFTDSVVLLGATAILSACNAEITPPITIVTKPIESKIWNIKAPNFANTFDTTTGVFTITLPNGKQCSVQKPDELAKAGVGKFIPAFIINGVPVTADTMNILLETMGGKVIRFTNNNQPSGGILQVDQSGIFCKIKYAATSINRVDNADIVNEYVDRFVITLNNGTDNEKQLIIPKAKIEKPEIKSYTMNGALVNIANYKEIADDESPLTVRLPDGSNIQVNQPDAITIQGGPVISPVNNYKVNGKVVTSGVAWRIMALATGQLNSTGEHLRLMTGEDDAIATVSITKNGATANLDGFELFFKEIKGGSYLETDSSYIISFVNYDTTIKSIEVPKAEITIN